VGEGEVEGEVEDDEGLCMRRTEGKEGEEVEVEGVILLLSLLLLSIRLVFSPPLLLLPSIAATSV
jgi:hypothetical protein